MAMTLPGQATSWSTAAATSVRPVRPAVGAAVRVKSLTYPHTAVVLKNTGRTGLDGRDWVQVAVSVPYSTTPWEVHFEKKDLEEVVSDPGA